MMNKPEKLKEVDLKDLIDTCQAYLDYVGSDDYHEDNDYDHYIFEAAMMGLFGKDVFKWINAQYD